VYGYQEHRKGRLFERLTGGLFWWLFNVLSSTKLPRHRRTGYLPFFVAIDKGYVSQ
jgi:hypothetical protein